MRCLISLELERFCYADSIKSMISSYFKISWRKSSPQEAIISRGFGVFLQLPCPGIPWCSLIEAARGYEELLFCSRCFGQAWKDGWSTQLRNVYEHQVTTLFAGSFVASFAAVRCVHFFSKGLGVETERAPGSRGQNWIQSRQKRGGQGVSWVGSKPKRRGHELLCMGAKNTHVLRPA